MSILAVIGIIIVAVVTPLIIIDIVVHTSVYGKPLKNREIKEMLYDGYRLNSLSDSMLSEDTDKLTDGYIAKSRSILSKWHIVCGGYKKRGVIPRWSPYSEELDDILRELLNKKHNG